MRADAFVTLNLVHPVRKLFPPKGRRVPILMYHSISNRPEQGHPYYRTVTSPEMFARHMRHLHEHRYSVVSLSDALEYIEDSKTFSSQPVVITFDDGYGDFYTEAFPVLSKHGFTATVYLPTAFIGNVAQLFKGQECLTWSQVRELQTAGVEFGSHTVTHPQLKSSGAKDVHCQLQTSKETIEQKLGYAVNSFAYPNAFPETDRGFVGLLKELLKECGYHDGVSTIIGRVRKSDDRLFMKRLPVNSHDDPRFFRAKLEGAYDWLHAVQYASKLFI